MGQIDKNVVMLGWVSFFTDMASAMINPILPIFVVVDNALKNPDNFLAEFISTSYVA